MGTELELAYQRSIAVALGSSNCGSIACGNETCDTAVALGSNSCGSIACVNGVVIANR